MTVTLEGDTLGKKHQQYNKLVQDAVAKGNYVLNQIKSEDRDLDNLLKIDIACKTRNVDYIIEVLKSNDMLYVSRAIKKSPWLITDPQYANIINPEYLHSQLLPTMHTKAVNKLMLNIRINLKEPCRVEAFYNHLKGSSDACKWLLNCSVLFIEDAIKNEHSIPRNVFKRLCKKSISFLSYYEQVDYRNQITPFEEYLLLFRSNPTEMLDLVEKMGYLSIRKIGRKQTDVLMKKCSQRIFDKFDFYMSHLDLNVVAKHLQETGIRAFLEEKIKNDTVKYRFNYYGYLKHFVKNMPFEERYQFIKETFIDKANALPNDAPMTCLKNENNSFSCKIESYQWYEYAPYNEAFNNLIKLTQAESSPSERCTILTVLVKCARNNPQHIKSLLEYYYKKHINEPFQFKIRFVNKVLTLIPSNKFNDETWNVLEQIFHSMEVYRESINDVQTCVKAIIIYKVINDAKVPEIVEQKFNFDTLKKSCNKLNQEQQEKMFSYLLNLVSGQIERQHIENETNFNEMIRHINNMFSLLKDWKKDINNYPFILDHIKKVIIIKKDNMWKTDVSSLYNVKKSWRRYMFEDSFTFCQNEEVCLNALKHNPQLLTRFDKELETLRTNDKVTLRRLLAKLRVYWPESIAQQWTDAYLLNLNKATEQKAVIRGLFMLMTQKRVVGMAEKYRPEDSKIKWGETNPTDINLRKYIAQSLHVARPLVPLETVLWYAKQDYLQYAVPSINAVMYYMSKEQSRNCLTMLLESPVSLQKYGIRYAFVKLRPDELKPIYSKLWLSTKNSSIRAVLFTHTYKLLCKTNNQTVERELWELLSTFIDNLTSDDNKLIFHKLTRLKDLPLGIQPDFFMKGYNFLMLLPERSNGQMYVNRLLKNAPKIIGLLDEDFVVEKLLTPLEEKFFSKSDQTIEFLAIFVLSSKNEEDQLRRHRRVLIPTMELAFQSWDKVNDRIYVTKNKFKYLVSSLIWNFVKLVCVNNITPPAKLFIEIQKMMEDKLSIDKNYLLYTSWKLTTEYVKLIDENKSLLSVFEPFENSNIIINPWLPFELASLWDEIDIKISQKLGLKFVEHFKNDTKQYFPTIQRRFGDAIKKMFQDLTQKQVLKLETLYHMLDENFVPSYILVSKLVPKFYDKEFPKTWAAIREKLRSHPSKEVQMHYYIDFDNVIDDVLVL